ncbi:translation initiation factor IF-2 [Tepiditoga spiralis]|uniref:Translation initiation factor IF-2 n=1 Tax=Tepiditoga spiralis TaxID=2108365 RepID=A0A7G1G601_9BACT|nr:translation initiation factor IF-2 [Tepiditoga spiralis]BBE30267.1 translation initiation factor IF-2 [Tepiditoga spiralis]
MSKTRVYELAKELNISTKELMNYLEKELGLEIKSHMSTLDEDSIETIKEFYNSTKKKSNDNKKKIPNKNNSKVISNKNKIIKNEVKENKEIKEAKNETKKESSKEDNIKEIILSSNELKLDLLAKKLHKNQGDLIKSMFMKGIMIKPNQDLNIEIAEEIAMNFNYILTINDDEQTKPTETKQEKDILKERWEKIYSEKKDKFKDRAPVVTVMGHVDHGKTTLLDHIRKTQVADKEAGGITQSIGAYQTVYNGKKITFIDTPGHEAFTEMRARGAQSTDIVILIVAADDGVMPQTIEAYNHAKDAGVPIIVAINKVDKPNANVELTKQQLVAKLNLIPEDWGGDAITVPISAKSGMGVDDLLEMVLLVSEMQEIKCYPKGNARAIIIESKLDKFLGPVATVIVKDGILKNGDFFVAGSTFGKVRRLIDSNGKTIKQAGPSTPVQILGFDEVPSMHSILYAVNTLDEAREISSIAKEKEESKSKQKKHVKLEDFMNMMKENQKKILNIILKAGTYGEIEALKNSISKLKNSDIDIEIVHAGIGAITTSDVMLASASNAVILGFRVKADSKTLKMADKEEIQIKRYDIIFNLIDELKKALQGMLEPEEKEEITGSGKIKEVFKIKKVGNIAGIQLTDGYVSAEGRVRIYREGKLIQDVEIETLQHYKDIVKSVSAPQECGIKFVNFNDFNSGDELEFYKYIQIERTLNFNSKK